MDDVVSVDAFKSISNWLDVYHSWFFARLWITVQCIVGKKKKKTKTYGKLAEVAAFREKLN